jgi:lipopolysaccharide/colanic/teichoic acid biosynthesis glycosyltransferase
MGPDDLRDGHRAGLWYGTDQLEAAGPSLAREAARLTAPLSSAIVTTGRTIDILISLGLLSLTAPLLLVAALLIRADSHGPVLYRQERVGLNGKRFAILSLRTMYTAAEAVDPHWVGTQHLRVTNVGRFLRISHIDKLRQLFNVLAGTMSVIGPRPERPHFVRKLASIIPHYEERLMSKPGITGLAQVRELYRTQT